MSARPALAVVLVHWHAAQPLGEAVAALERDLAASGVDVELRIIDNGSTIDERAALDALGLPIAAGAGNRGFAAGVNQGVAATSAPVVLVLNPDVVVLPGCVRALLDELERGAAAAAPRLYWDPERRFLLPPGEERGRGWDLLSLLATRWAGCAARARRRWRADARRHWEGVGSIRSTRLSGACLAFTRAAWERVGPFDEGYRLYFEETDWLLRLEAAGLEARQAARAEAVHGFAHSTRQEPDAAAWFEQSARRFRERYYGGWYAAVRDRIASAVAGGAPRVTGALPAWSAPTLPSAIAPPADATLWLELSPNRSGFPAAGERVRAADLAAWRPPAALMRASGLAAMSLAAVTMDGRELGRWWVELES